MQEKVFNNEKNCHYFTLNDGKQIPCIGFGTFELKEGKEAKKAVLDALAVGYRMIDCARLYANERSVGQALRESRLARKDIFVTSKVWNDRQIAGQDEVRRSVEESLEALGIDQLDLLLIHWPVRNCFKATWETFQRLKEEKLTKSIGVSNFLKSHLEELMNDGDEVPAVNQIEFHPYLQDAEILSYCAEHQILIEAWSPLGRGMCVNDPAILKIAKTHGVDAGQVILAWEIAKGVVPLPRSSKPSRIKGNLRATELSLSAEDIATLDGLNQMKYTIEGVDPVHFNETLKGISSPHN